MVMFPEVLEAICTMGLLLFFTLGLVIIALARLDAPHVDASDVDLPPPDRSGD